MRHPRSDAEEAFAQFFRDWLKAQRKRHGFSVATLAAALEISGPTLTQWERGICMPGAFRYEWVKTFFAGLDEAAAAAATGGTHGKA